MTLIDELEIATEGSRDLDVKIAVALFQDTSDDDDHQYAQIPHIDDGVAPGCYWIISRSGKSLKSAPFYTFYVDAALKAVPEGWGTDGKHTHQYNDGKWIWGLYKYHSLAHVNSVCVKSNPALVLCIAAVKAAEADK